MIRELPLYVSTAHASYNGQQFKQLQEDVRSAQLNTKLIDLYSSRQLFLLENATTDEGYVYTKQAFTQLCVLAAPGLTRLLQDLSGTIPRRYDTLYDAQLAIRTFNAVLNTRFRSIERFLVVLDSHRRQIIGFVPARNYLLDNQTWLDKILESFTVFDQNLSFVGARSEGRALALWFRSKTQAASAIVNQERIAMFDGVYYCNGEALNSAVRGVRACFSSAGILLGGFKDYGSTVRHSSVDFESSFDQLLEKVAVAELPISELANALATLAKKKLVTNFATMRSVRSIKRALTSQLTEFKVRGAVANSAIDRALYGDRSVDDYLEDDTFLSALANKNWAELLLAILKDAKRYSFARREQIEQAIFDFLINSEGDSDV